MKQLLIAAAVLTASSSLALAQSTHQWGGMYGGFGTGSNSSSHSVSPYTNSHGTYVGGHRQTNPNSTQYDNYSTRGNYNPYTGRYGTRTRWPS